MFPVSPLLPSVRTEPVHVTRVASEHGFDDYDVRGIEAVHRACVPHGIGRGDRFNVYCAEGVKLGATWRGSLKQSLLVFAGDSAALDALREQIRSEDDAQPAAPSRAKAIREEGAREAVRDFAAGRRPIRRGQVPVILQEADALVYLNGYTRAYQSLASATWAMQASAAVVNEATQAIAARRPGSATGDALHKTHRYRLTFSLSPLEGRFSFELDAESHAEAIANASTVLRSDLASHLIDVCIIARSTRENRSC